MLSRDIGKGVQKGGVYICFARSYIRTAGQSKSRQISLLGRGDAFLASSAGHVTATYTTGGCPLVEALDNYLLLPLDPACGRLGRGIPTTLTTMLIACEEDDGVTSCVLTSILGCDPQAPVPACRKAQFRIPTELRSASIPLARSVCC